MSRAPDTNLVGGELHRAGRAPVPGAPHARALELVPIEALTALAVASEEA